jgi:hypothetical protein
VALSRGSSKEGAIVVRCGFVNRMKFWKRGDVGLEIQQAGR